MADFKDAVRRVYIGFFGIAWFALHHLTLGLGMRELSFSFREWWSLAQQLAGLLLVILSCLPQFLLRIKTV
jgi:hypothetical protein